METSRRRLLLVGWITAASAVAGVGGVGSHAQSPAAGASASAASAKAVVDQYCVTCHNERLKTAGLALDALQMSDIGAQAPVWEKVVVKLRAGLMPPAGMPRPDKVALDRFTSSLEAALDRAAAANPNPGRTGNLHRLNRTEYQNAVRDLLAVDIDFAELLPADDVSYGFDNIGGILKLSPLLTERYLSVAQKVTRLALGGPAVNADLFTVPEELSQEDRLEGMPPGTRGGLRVQYIAPRDGEYVIKVRLARDLEENLPDFLGPQHLEVSLDGQRLQVFTVDGGKPVREDGVPGFNVERRVAQAPKAVEKTRAGVQTGNDAGGSQTRDLEYRLARRGLDAAWDVRVPIKAGTHEVRATFLKKTSGLSEGLRRPFLRQYAGGGSQSGSETRDEAYLRTVEILGPYVPAGAEGSASYRRIFSCRPARAADEAACARTILSALARHAYRRPATERDLHVLLEFYDAGRADGGFEAGIEFALQRLLVSPEFLFRTEFTPEAVPRKTSSGIYRISDLELASRLSFFLWSSIPDDELLTIAAQGRLRNPVILERQVKRMLKDPRSEALVKNFAGQWLYLRNLPNFVPDRFLFPDVDESLRLALRRETELFFDSIVREDRSALELLTADYTFVNERLAQHYAIPNVKGAHFRRVTFAEDSPRRGLLGHGSILSVTSLPNRTSPVIRGKWILENFLGSPPPDPPPNVPSLTENDHIAKAQTLRQRIEQHRANPVCAACHKLMDPLGFALEAFDAVGKFRTYDENFQPIDASGVYPDGTAIDGPAGLRRVLLDHSDRFLTTLTDKLLTYAIGRGVEYFDAPAVRAIKRGAAADDYRISSLILGIVKSPPFHMRKVSS